MFPCQTLFIDGVMLYKCLLTVYVSVFTILQLTVQLDSKRFKMIYDKSRKVNKGYVDLNELARSINGIQEFALS